MPGASSRSARLPRSTTSSGSLPDRRRGFPLVGLGHLVPGVDLVAGADHHEKAVHDQRLTANSSSTDSATIQRAGRALIDAVGCPARVILFGPYATGSGDLETDLRFLVITEEVDNRFKETARLDKVLGRLLIPADVILATSEETDRPQVKGSVIDEALTSGLVIAES